MDNLEPTFEYYSERFLDAFYHCFNKFIVQDSRVDIVNFLVNDITSVAMYLSFTPGDIVTMSDAVFKNSNVRDFVFMLISNFHHRIDRGGNEWNLLVERLSKSYAVNDHELDINFSSMITPEVVSSRLPNVVKIKEYLTNNRWLVILSMIDQVISLADIQKVAPETPKSRLANRLPMLGTT